MNGRIKRITGYAPLARYMSTIEDAGEIQVTPDMPRSPYAYSQERQTYRDSRGRRVYIVETRHRTYDVFEVRQ